MEGAIIGATTEDQLVVGDENALDGFKLPYPVATVADFEQRAYLDQENGNTPEWLYIRAHTYCQISQDPTRMLRLNKASLQTTFQGLQVPMETNFHFRGQGERNEGDGVPWTEHTFGSGGYFVFLFWLLRNRALRVFSKVKALDLCLGMAQKALEYACLVNGGVVTCMALLLDGNGTLHSQELHFNQQGVCHQEWQQLLGKNAGAMGQWEGLMTRTWLNRCITSSVAHASFQDILFFLAFTWCHQNHSVARTISWKICGMHCLPIFINRIAKWLDHLAQHLGQQSLQKLPVLKTKTGKCRRLADPVNRILLLWQIRKEKVHRNRVAQTHDFGSASLRMVRFENYLDSFLYLDMLKKTFGSTVSQQISVSWDPSSYGGKDTFIGVIYNPHQNIAAYLPSQQLSQVRLSDLEDSLLPLARARKLTRLDGFKELKGLSSSLKGVGIDITEFIVPNGLLCRPLGRREFRLVGPDGVVYVHNEEDGTTVPQVPRHLDLGALPCLLSISDQGPNNTAALNFLMFSKQAILFWSTWDPFHRCWNDIKGALRKASCRAWRVVLEMTLVANMNYGPFGSSTWFFKKKAKLEQFLLTCNVGSDLWQQFQHLIAMERKQGEPNSLEESQALLDSMAEIESFLNKGPLIKLMRWFSFFETMAWYTGDLWATKMVLLHDSGFVEEESAAEVELPSEKADDRKELQELKKRKGTWKLAPSLINERNIAIKDCVLAVGKASWKHFAERARELLSPDHILEYHIACSARGFWKAELAEMIQQSLWDAKNLEHLVAKWQMHPDALEWHVDIFEKLLEARSMSLVAFYCMPPALYHHLLSPNPAEARQAHDLALSHYKRILHAEEAEAGGTNVEPLASIYWRLNPFIRTLYMAYEQDKQLGLVMTGDSKALRLQKVVSRNLGDSRLIENTHQHGRDLYRSSKASSFSNPTIFANALRSGALEERRVPRLRVAEAEKASAAPVKAQCKDGINSSLRSQGHKLPKQMQLLMAPKSKTHTWPSPAPSSLFPSAAATTWLFHFYMAEEGSPLKAKGVNAAWLSCLAQPGSILAQRSTGRMLKVMASAEFGLLAVSVGIEVRADGARHYVCHKDREAIGWHHIMDLDDWIHVQVVPCMVHAGGPVGWSLSGGPVPLEYALCMRGVNITYQQIKKLLQALGGSVKGTPSKKVLRTRLIELVLPEELWEKAKAMVPEDQQVSEDFDTDLSEVVSELGHDDGNAQDLKDLKEKKKARRLRYKYQKGGDQVVQGPEKKKSKGKGKKKGKARRKARERARARAGGRKAFSNQ